jgi:threonine/homoserine/homoserine lactone efflux protein
MMITATGSAVGFMRGLPCAAGAAAGMGTLLFFAALGLGHLVLASPVILKGLNIGGALFLLWLAWRIATSSGSPKADNQKPVGFVGAAVFQWANPKGWLVAVAAASTYLQSTTESELAQATIFGLLFFVAALPCGLVWLGLGALVRRFLEDARKARAFNIVMAAALAASVLLIFR